MNSCPRCGREVPMVRGRLKHFCRVKKSVIPFRQLRLWDPEYVRWSESDYYVKAVEFFKQPRDSF